MCNLNDKHLYVVHIKNLQQALNQSKKTIMQLTKWFSGKLLAINLTKTKVAMNKTVYLGFLSKVLAKLRWMSSDTTRSKINILVRLNYATKIQINL